MQHDGIMVAIILILSLAIPAIIVIRVYSTVFSGIKSKPSAVDSVGAPEGAANPGQADNQKPADTGAG